MSKKYSKEFKLKVRKEHEEETSFYSLEKKYGITLGTVKRWNSAFRAHGEEVLAHQNSNLCRYTAEFKKEVVLDYLSGDGSFQSVAVKYGIHAESTVLKWVKQYNSHVQGNSIYFSGENKIFKNNSGSRAALNINLFLLIRPYCACETRVRAVFRSILSVSGELSFLALDASSRKITSRHQ